jgi:hypothetical protein
MMKGLHPGGAGALLAFVGAIHCSGSSAPSSAEDSGGGGSSTCSSAVTAVDASAAEIARCFPDHDGINGGNYTFELRVDDTGFSKTILATQNDATVTLTLTNMGTKPHGFEVECTSVVPAYPTIPAGCTSIACFPSGATIAPLAPGQSKTVTFATPTPDGLLYPFRSSEPGDCAVPGLNGEHDALQWSLM